MKVLITAGPTREAIDPVRYISNHSTGKMGIALAEAFAAHGAAVTLVLGPTAITTATPGIEVVNVQSAADMYNACSAVYDSCDIAVFSAAVADYTPRTVAGQKVKKNEDSWNLELIKTVDIASEMGKRKTHQVNVVFALETNDEEAHAIEKLRKKNADFVVLNSMQHQGAGFGFDTNRISIVNKDETITNFGLKPKTEVAADIMRHALALLKH
jgi:phosphopantothenoylcysteine decarboxylase/phosphopantothenate--cysteine ligase